MLKLKGALYEQQLTECLDVTGASAMDSLHPGWFASPELAISDFISNSN